MNKKDFIERIANEVLIIDGAMGTMLQGRIPVQGGSEKANLDHPDVVASVHKAYADAGADIVTTNTFGGSRLKLAAFGLEKYVVEINESAARLARKILPDNVLVAGDIGPTGHLIDPMGDLSFDEAYDAFAQQAIALANGGVDLFLLETFADLKEIKAAVMAARDHTDLPIMASMTYEEDYRTFTGTSPEAAAVVLTSLGVDVLGVNCSSGPEPMLEILGRYALSTHLPLFAEPNAGLPTTSDHGDVYEVTASVMADYARRFVDIGAHAVGSCCGSNPEFTTALRDAIHSRRPVPRQLEPGLRLASRSNVLVLGSDYGFGVIGERINPTNREELAESLRQGKVGHLQDEARTQIEQGAMLLDVNIGVPGIDEPAMMAKAVTALESTVKVPLVIDSTNPEAIEAALKAAAGKVLINSVHGSEESMQAILPLAKKYGAAVLCLAVGEKGIPKTPEARLKVVRTIMDRAASLGIPSYDLIADCLTLTVSAEQKRANATLHALQIVKEQLNLPTVLGVSNISFGLPERSLINATFLSMAMGMGLDAAIMNPGDKHMMEAVRAASVLTVRDRDSRAFVASHSRKKKKKTDIPAPAPTTIEARIIDAVIAGQRDDITSLVDSALEAGNTAQAINDSLLIPAINEVGSLYDKKEIFLPQMILAAETMQRAFAVLEPHFASGDVVSAGKVLICTVRGDVHDIGKNIVGLFLKNKGYDVIDLGKDVAAQEIVDKAVEHGVDIVGLSALMTTTMVEMPKVISALREAGHPAKVIIGGAVVTKRYAREIGADGYAADGVAAVEMAAALIGGK